MSQEAGGGGGSDGTSARAAGMIDASIKSAPSSPSHETSVHIPQKMHYLTLFLISTYSIGKERILEAVAARCGIKIFVSDRKAALMACLDHLPQDIFTLNPNETPLHVVPWNFLGEVWPFFRPNYAAPMHYIAARGATRMVGFVPTGWVSSSGMKNETKTTEFPISIRSRDACEIHLVPYSEHSSYDELQQFVGWLKPHEVVPTVLDAGGDGKASRILRHFTLLTDSTASKAKFLDVFSKTRRNKGGAVNGGRNEGMASPPCLNTHGGCAEERESKESPEIVDFVAVQQSGGGGNGSASQLAEEEEEEEECLLLGGLKPGARTPPSPPIPGRAESPSTKDVASVSIATRVDSVEELLVSLSGGAISTSEVGQLLRAAGGDVDRAADLFFSGTWRSPSGMVSPLTTHETFQSKKINATGGGGGGAADAGGKRRRIVGRTKANGQQSILSFLGKEPKLVGDTPPNNAPTKSPHNGAAHLSTALDVACPSTTKTPVLEAGDRSHLVSKDAVILPLEQYHPLMHAPWSPGTPSAPTFTWRGPLTRWSQQPSD